MRRFLIHTCVVLITLALPAGTANMFPTVSSAHQARPVRIGSLVLVGGGNLPDVIRQRFLDLAGGKNARIVLIPSASAQPEAPARSFAFWKTADVKSVRVLHTTCRCDADDPQFYGMLKEATGVWIAGGDQSRLSDIYGHTAVERELVKVVERGGVVGGTSAGASIASDVMVAGPGKVGKGFGLLSHTLVDQHFSNRGRLPRLLDLLRSHPGQLGIGIDEETAVVIRGGEFSVLGNATVTVATPEASGSAVKVYRSGSRFAKPALVSVVSR